MKNKPLKEKKFLHIFVGGILPVGSGILFTLCLLLAAVWNDHGTKSHCQDTNIVDTRWEPGDVLRGIVVISAKSDPYYGLAQKIAQEEGAEITEDIADALAFNPMYMILVATPENLTPERLLEMGCIFKKLDFQPILGIITGSTLEKAEQLWGRRNLARAGNHYAGGDTETVSLFFEPTIFDISTHPAEKFVLTKENLIEVLKKADYFYWWRHSGPRTWFWNSDAKDWGDDDQLFAKDIPRLKPVVIYSPTCEVFRPWVEDSIALGFVDQGAAAYLGFVNSPHTAAFIKRGLTVPGITSWQEFPLGVIMQIENRAAIRSIFSVPQFFMMGDPRVYLSEKPYEFISDSGAENERRIIRGQSGVEGLLPVKIENGAEYDFVVIQGVTAVSEQDILNNSKLKMLNIGADKYLLFLHAGGDFQIELSRKAAFGWVLADTVIDALDYSWVVLWLNREVSGNPTIYAVALVIFAVFYFYTMLKKRKTFKDYQKIFLIALVIALFRLGYYLLRVNHYTVSANLINHTALQVALGFAGVFATLSGGLMLIKDSHKPTGKILGLVFATLPQFYLTGFYFVFLTLMNNATAITKMTVPWIWNYQAFWLPCSVLLMEMGIVLMVSWHKTVLHSDPIA